MDNRYQHRVRCVRGRSRDKLHFEPEIYDFMVFIFTFFMVFLFIFIFLFALYFQFWFSLVLILSMFFFFVFICLCSPCFDLNMLFHFLFQLFSFLIWSYLFFFTQLFFPPEPISYCKKGEKNVFIYLFISNNCLIKQLI